MATTIHDLGRQYAARIQQAVARDESHLTKSLTKKASDLASSNLGYEIIAIGREMDGLTFEDGRPLTEDAKEEIVTNTADALGWHRPRTLRMLTKGGSVDALLTMTQQLAELFNAVKKETKQK